MEENNNQQVPTTTPEAPTVTETPTEPVVAETDNMEVHPVPSLVIEDTSAPEVPVAPEEPVAPVAPEVPAATVEPVAPAAPEVPVAPIAPEVPAAIEEPVAPVAPEVPAATVEPVAPIAPEVPVATVEPVATATPEVPAAPAQGVGTEEKPKKKNHNTLAIIVILICVGVAAYYLLTRNSTDTTPGGGTSNNSTPSQTTDLSSISLNQVNINGVTFAFPANKEGFSSIGWAWDEEYAKKDVEPSTSANGGRIGNEPGGVMVMVYNSGTTTAHVEDCPIYSATFVNSKDGSDNVTFVGGLRYTSNPEEVKAKMTSLGYTNVNETNGNNAYNLRYFLNDDVTNVNNYVEFSFAEGVIETVTISTAY